MIDINKIIEVASLQEYISEIEKINSDEYYYRGEPSLKYNQILASAFRTYEQLFKKEEYEYIDYRKILAEYYSEIAHELNSIERENFIFYAQHHGLPTSLIDITSNPLTALYFACSTNFEENEGRVHLFAKKYTIDISDYNHLENITFNEFFLDNELTLKIYEELYDLNEEIKQEIIRRFLKDLGKKTNSLYKLIKENYKDYNAYIFDEIIKNICSLDLDEYDSTRKFISEFDSYFEMNFKKNPSKEKFRVALGQKNKPYFFELHSSKYMKDKLALIIIFLTKIQFDYLDFDTQHRKLPPGEYSKLTDRYDIYFPNIVVHPSVKFERMKSQEGSFLYQIAKYNAPTGAYRGFSKITSDLQIVIRDKKRIFRALDTMGINQKNLFGDHDSIASYLKQNRLYY